MASLDSALPGTDEYKMDVEMDADRRFFRKHKKRQHRVRLAFPVEKRLTLTAMNLYPLSNDSELYVAVQKLKQGKRVRLFFRGPRLGLQATFWPDSLDYSIRPEDFKKLKEKEEAAVFASAPYDLISVDDVKTDHPESVSLGEALGLRPGERPWV